jgi:hypothetical protein
MNPRRLVAVFAALSLALGTTASGAMAGGNSANAKLCQKSGWTEWVTAEGTPFANAGQCVSYAAQGGSLTPLGGGGGE